MKVIHKVRPWISRVSLFLLSLILSGTAFSGDIVFDFETGDRQGWTVVEGNFEQLICDRAVFHNPNWGAYNKQGRYFLTTVELSNGGSDDGMTGVVESPVFQLEGKTITLLVGGGSHPDTYVALCSEDGTELLKAHGVDTETMQWVEWDASASTGQNVFVRVVDKSQGGWGHITLDDFRTEGTLDPVATEKRFQDLDRLGRERIAKESADRLRHAIPSCRAAVVFLSETYGPAYPNGSEFLKQLDAYQLETERASREDIIQLWRSFDALRYRALIVENPDFPSDTLLFIRRRQVMGGSHYAYTEAVSWAEDRERHFDPPAALCTLNIQAPHDPPRVLVDAPHGVIRDPDVYWDGRKILYAQKNSMDEDDYHLYEFNLDSGAIRQLTHDAGFADYEGCYLPDGSIAFNSTRCVQTVPCWITPVSNLYKMDGDGRNIRRISYNQVHDNFPSVMNDGRLLYTRWEYNDRGQLWLQGLFVMNPDGTGGTSYYGNNSYWPVTMIHARSIPGSNQIVSTLCGHHTDQSGEIGLFDITRGNEEAQGCLQIWPDRKVEPIHIETYTRELKSRFQYPYPLSEHFILASGMSGTPERYGIYLIDTFGNRVLIYQDSQYHHLHSPMPLAPRKRPPIIPSKVDYTVKEGTIYLDDIYRGPGLAGVPRGTVKQLRLIELIFRPYGSPQRGLAEYGPGGGGGLFPPVGLQSSWDVKRIIGTVPVEEDGSALFTVPADTPISLQPLDAQGKALQMMRSWLTVMPGENVSCVGCHEYKRDVSPPMPRQVIGKQLTQPTPWYVTNRPFMFHEDIQPILDRRCISCHDQNHPTGIDLRGDKTDGFSLGYEHLKRFTKTPGPQDVPHMIPAKSTGAIVSPLISLLEKGHHDVRLPQEEMDWLIAWIDINTNYYGSYALTRPDAFMGRCAVPDPAPLMEALGDACSSCHTEGFNWRLGVNQYLTEKAVLVNLTHPDQSRLLCAALPQEEGGLGLHEISPFQAKNDPRYMKALQVIQSWADELIRHPREDMAGAEPDPANDEWLEKRKESEAIEVRSRAYIIHNNRVSVRASINN